MTDLVGFESHFPIGNNGSHFGSYTSNRIFSGKPISLDGIQMNPDLYTSLGLSTSPDQPGSLIFRSSPVTNNQSPTGRTVLPIDPSIFSEKLKQIAMPSLLSPKYPSAATPPPLGSLLQTPPDLTPVKVSAPVSLPQVPSIRPDLASIRFDTQSTAKTNSEPRLIVTPVVNPVMLTPLYEEFDILNELPPASASALPTASAAYGSAAYGSMVYGSAAYGNAAYRNAETAYGKAEGGTLESRVAEAKKRADYRVKFSILREAYPTMEIPEPQDNQTVEEIEIMYKQYVKRIHIDTSVEQNEMYLLILWLVIEVIGTRLFKQTSFSGYTKNQFKYVKKYRMLLIELGEESYASEIGEGWPVYIKILAMAAFNGVIFFLVQMLANKIGGVGKHSDEMGDELRELITNYLTKGKNKTKQILKKADEATSDHPQTPVSAKQEDESPPMGQIGSLLSNVVEMFGGSGGGGGGEGGLGMLSNLIGAFSGGGGNNNEQKPQMRRPTTFGNRRKRNQENNDTNQ